MKKNALQISDGSEGVAVKEVLVGVLVEHGNTGAFPTSDVSSSLHTVGQSRQMTVTSGQWCSLPWV